MKYLKQLLIILMICLIGEAIAGLLPFTFPGNIMAMMILAILLATRLIKEEQIKEVSDYLLELLALFIIPISVSVINHLELVRQIWVQLLVICLMTLVMTFASCAFTIRFVSKLMNRDRKGVE